MKRLHQRTLFWNQLTDGCEIVYRIETSPRRMREFAMRDLNGFILQLRQEQAS